MKTDKLKNLHLLSKLSIQLDDKANYFIRKSKKQLLTQEEVHIISAFKQADLQKAGKLKTVDAKEFLNNLN